MVGVDELLSLVLADAAPRPPTKGLLHESRGQVLAQDIFAVNPLPWFANAAMDGFAVRRADLASYSSISIVDHIAAGMSNSRRFGDGQGVAISTGAALPPELDTVVPLEIATFAEGRITVRGDIPGHGHVRLAGEDVLVGSRVAERGAVLTDPLTTLALATGITHVAAYTQVRVHLVTVGDELVVVGTPIEQGFTQDFNNELLMTPISGCGCWVHGATFCPDDGREIAKVLGTGGYDVIVTTGGLGPGARDVVADAIARAGTVRAFDVAMRPGKAFAFGRVGTARVYALPGNPGAALAAFHALVAPALRRLSGRPAHPPKIQAVLTEPIANTGGRRHFVRATLAWDGPTLAATPTGRQGSGLVSDIAAADALVVIHESVERAEPGDIVHILPLKPIGGA